jgi:ribonuclease HI
MSSDAKSLEGRWVVYTDGACAPSNPGPSGWGAVLIAPDGGESDHYGFIGPGTNQIAELTAALEGLSRVPPVAAVELVSDSQYVLKGLSEWRAGWERKGYRNSKGEPVANLGLWKRLFAAADARRVTTRWVRGHNGDPRNERADALANKALASKGSSAG